MFLLSAKFMIWFPYKYRCDWFPKWFSLYFCNLCITLLAKVTLWVAKKGHENKKWLVSSMPWPQRHLSEGLSMKLWLYLWYLKRLNPTLNWRRYLSPKGLCIPKMFSLRTNQRKNVVFKDINWWNIIKMSDDIIPRGTCIWEETTQVSGRATSYFMKDIIKDRRYRGSLSLR